jgi:hypothetical protein
VLEQPEGLLYEGSSVTSRFGEDEDGDLRKTDQIMKVHVEFLDLFRPVGITID